MDFLISGITSITPQQIVMYVIGAVLIWLAINKDLEPVLLLPLGFGAILVNLPASGVLNQTLAGIGETNGIIEWLFNVGIEASEAMPLLLFIGIGAMIDFGPLLSNPKLFLFGAAAQFGIFAAIVVACFLGFDLKDAASIGIIGAADGPTSILVSQVLGSNYIGPIAVVAYSYMALVPIIQPMVIKLLTTKKERCIHMEYKPATVSKKAKIIFPIVVTFIAGLVAPMSVSLVGFLMFGNLQGNVIGRYQHNSVQTLLHGKNFIKIGGNIGSAVSNAGNAGSSHGNLVGKLAVFQCQKSCHDLYRTSGKKLLIHIFCVDNGIGGFFHNNCGCGSDISSLGPARNSVGGNSGSCLGGSYRCWKHQGKSHSQGKKPGA